MADDSRTYETNDYKPVIPSKNNDSSENSVRNKTMETIINALM